MHAFQDRDGTLRSLNRARVGSLPQALADPEIIGQSGLHLASGWALTLDLAAQAPTGSPEPTTADLPRGLDRVLGDPATPAPVRREAEATAQRLGHRLGCLLLALKLGDPATRAMRPEWGDAQWSYWRDLQHIVIGGGLLSGHIGELALPAAQAVLDAHGAPDLRLTCSRFGRDLALVGLARCLPAPAETRWVFDFGQTSVKRGVARYVGGSVAALEVRAPVASVCPSIAATAFDHDEAESQWTAMLDILAQSVAEGPAPSTDGLEIGMCLACYLFDGHPAPQDVGCYGRLSLLAPNLTIWIQAGLEERFGRPVRLHLLHDGTAAARSEDGDAHTLVLTIGTALGSGFPEMNGPLAPLADSFRLTV